MKWINRVEEYWKETELAGEKMSVMSRIGRRGKIGDTCVATSLGEVPMREDRALEM